MDQPETSPQFFPEEGNDLGRRANPFAAGLLYAYAVVYPFFMFSVLFSRDSIPFWVVVAMTGFVLLTVATRLGKLWVDASMWPLLGLIVVYLCSTTFLVASDAGLRWLGRTQLDRAVAVDLRLVEVVIAYVVFVNLMAVVSRRQLENVLRIQMWGGCLIAAYGVGQFVTATIFGSSLLPIIPPTNDAYSARGTMMLVGHETVYRATSIFSEPAYFAFFLVPPVTKVIMMWFGAMRLMSRRSLIIVTVVLVSALACNFSMTGILSMALVLALVILSTLRNVRGALRITALALVSVGIILAFTPMGSLVAGRATQIVSLSDPSTLDRLFRGWTGLQVFLEHPWFGIGPGGYAFVYPHIGGIQFNNMATPLNLWLSFVTDVGIGGLILLVWFLWVILRRAGPVRRHDPFVAVFYWSVVSYLILLTTSDNWFTEMFWFEAAMLTVTTGAFGMPDGTLAGRAEQGHAH